MCALCALTANKYVVNRSDSAFACVLVPNSQRKLDMLFSEQNMVLKKLLLSLCAAKARETAESTQNKITYSPPLAADHSG
jgi:hypothetical protein